MKSALYVLKISVSSAVIFLAYLFLFPNDFFLSKASFRHNPSFGYKNSFFRLEIYDKQSVNPFLLKVIKNPEKYLKQASIFKNNEKRTLGKLSFGQKKYLIKRFNYKNLYDWITKCPFRSSKAYRSWYYGFKLKEAKIETINPIAIIEKKWGPFWTQTYLITEFLEGEPLNRNFTSFAKEAAYSIKINDIRKKLYKLKWLHRDFICKNILLTKKGLVILDLDEMHSYTFHNFIFQKKCQSKHFAKFNASLPKNVELPSNLLMTDKLGYEKIARSV